MDWLEQELKAALERKEPSDDFAARVIRKAGSRSAPSQWHRWLAAAAAVVVLAGASVGYRRHQGSVAKEQVMRAFKITAVKVSHIQTQVQEAAR
jgi:hypothetical protein